MNKKPSPLLRAAKLISVFLFLCVFVGLFVFSVFLPRTTESDYDTLTKKPSFSLSGLLDGSYTAQWAEYFTDTIHNRDRFKDLYAQIKPWFGKETIVDDEIIIGPGGDPDDEDSFGAPSQSTSQGSDSSGSTSSNEEPSTDPSSNTSSNDEPPVEISSGLIIRGTRVMELYYGDSKLKRIPTFTDTLNQFAAKVPNVHVYSMVIPKSCAYYLQDSEKYGHIAGRTLNDLNAIEERLSSQVTSINIYDTLKAHANEEIYFRTDHHWTGLGAYYAVQKFAADLNLPFQDLSTYEKKVREGYVGTMYKFTDYDVRVLNNPEPFVTYIPQATYQANFYTPDTFQNPSPHSIFYEISDDRKSSWYMTFLNGDAKSVKIQSNACSNGRKLLVVKDSYGNALAPYLLYSFEEIYIVDARKFKLNLKEFSAAQGITDILFAECTFSATSDAYISDLQELCK